MDKENRLFLHNWIEEFHLRCSERWEIGLFGSIFFVGHVVGSIMLSNYGDTIGRISLMRIGQGATLFSYVYIVYLANNNVEVYFFIFLMGLLSCWRLSLSFLYGSEVIDEAS